jgi:membrane associated rhomboid family serine protease
MDQFTDYLSRLFTKPPWDFLSWPAAAMVTGTIIAIVSDKLARALGVIPRRAAGLPGIVTAPFIHANVAHLAANLPPFVVLGALILHRNEGRFVEVAATIALTQGALLWLFGRNAAHVGMSGVIFGFLGYLLAIAWFTRTMPDLLVAGGVMVFYGSMLAGVAPARAGTSWEGHLFGLLAGFGRAWLDTI